MENNSNSLIILFELLRADGSIVVNKKLARGIGINPAILYSELIAKYLYFQKRGELDSEGFFFNTIENLKKDTCLSKFQQKESIDKLRKLKLIDYKVKGIPAKRYFKILTDDKTLKTLNRLFLKDSGPETSLPVSSKLEGEKLAGNNTNNNTNLSASQPKPGPETRIGKTVEEKEKDIKTELSKLGFGISFIGKLFKEFSYDQIEDKIEALKRRKNVNNPSAYLFKILKSDYPNKNIPVVKIKEEEDYPYQRYKPPDDGRTLEEIKKDRKGFLDKLSEFNHKLKKGESFPVPAFVGSS